MASPRQAYFTGWPQVEYTLDNKEYVLVHNFLKHYSFRKNIKYNRSVYSDWIIRDEDTIFTIADKLYGYTHYYWVIAMLNDMLNPDWQWPLTDKQLHEYVFVKYREAPTDDVETVVTTTHHWIAVGTSPGYSDNIFDLPAGTKVDASPFYDPGKPWDGLPKYTMSHWRHMAGSTDDEKKQNAMDAPLAIHPVSRWIYEYNINEENRRIRLLRPELLHKIIKERYSILRNDFRFVTRGQQ